MDVVNYKQARIAEEAGVSRLCLRAQYGCGVTVVVCVVGLCCDGTGTCSCRHQEGRGSGKDV